jgi:tetratricopeptide (TPR) repeat protein
MNAHLRRFLAGLVLLLSVTTGRSQTTEIKQQEFAAHVKKAQEYLRASDPRQAIPEFEAAVTIDPDNVEIQANLGVLLYFQGKLQDAIPHLRIALDKKPELTKIQGLLGIAELHTLDFVGGRKDLVASFPSISDAKFKVDVGLELVGLYTQEGDLTAASEIIAQLRKAAPDNAEVLYAAYRTYADLSSESMMALALASPDSAQMHQVLAHEEIKEGNTNGAIAQFRRAIEIDPRLPGIHYELAELLNTSQDPNVKKQAEQEYHAALVSNPLDEKAESRLADIDAGKGNTQQAFAEYSKAVEIQPGDADAKIGLAKTLIVMDQLDKALQVLEQALQQDPTNPAAHYRLSTLYKKQGRMDDAKREVDLYTKFKDLKDKLRATYKELLIQPNEISADERNAN